MPQGYYYTIKKDLDGYRARFFYSGTLMWWTEGYSREADADNAVNTLRAYAASAPLYRY